MKNRQPLLVILSRKFTVLLCIVFWTACAHYSHADREDSLQTKIYQFNKRFEAKMMDMSASYLPVDQRRQFLTDSLKVKENVTFYESSILGAKLFNDNLPVHTKLDGPASEFNKAIVTIRYQLSILPSNQVKILIVDQLWLWQNNDWFVDPKLDRFFK